MSTYRLALLAAALSLAQGAAVSPVSAATLGGSATPGATLLGSSAAVDLDLLLSDPVVLQGLTLNLDWDADGLDFESASAMIFGQSLASFIGQFDPAFTVVTSGPGHLGVSLLADVVPPNLPAGAATMSFSFTGLALGVHNVTVDIHLTDGDFNDIPLTLASTVTVSPVPDSPPAAMLAAGLGVLALLMRRRRF